MQYKNAKFIFCSLESIDAKDAPVKGAAKLLMTMAEIRVAWTNLTQLKAMIPHKFSADALVTNRRYKYIPLLEVVVINHECTDEGHARVQYLLDQGADPNVATFINVSKNDMITQIHYSKCDYFREGYPFSGQHGWVI